MSYVSLLKTIPDFFSQPVGIAALASVGIHGVIAFLLPLMPVETKKTKEVKIPKTVGLVELDQADQKRIPQTNSTNITPNLQANIQTGVQLPEFATKATPLPRLAPPPLVTPPVASNQIMPPLPISRSELGIDPLPKNRQIKTRQSNPFRIRPQDRFGAKKSWSASRPELKFEDPIKNSNAGANQKLRTKVATGTNTGNNPRKDLQTSLPKVTPAEMPAALPGKPIPVSGNVTSVSTLPRGNQVLNNSSRGLKVTNNTTDLTSGTRLVTEITNSPQVNNVQTSQVKVKSPSRKKVVTEPELIARAKQITPNIQMQAVPLQPSLDLPAGEKATNVKGGLVVDGEGKINYFELLDKSVSSNLKVAVRDYFKNYFQKNPMKATGKPKYFSFNVVFEPGNTLNLRERLRAIKDQRGLKVSPSPNGRVPDRGVTNTERSSSSPVVIQSTVRKDRAINNRRNNQISQPGFLSQGLPVIPENSKGNLGNPTQVSSSSQENQKNLILRLRKLREQRQTKTKTSDFQ